MGFLSFQIWHTGIGWILRWKEPNTDSEEENNVLTQGNA